MKQKLSNINNKKLIINFVSIYNLYKNNKIQLIIFINQK